MNKNNLQTIYGILGEPAAIEIERQEVEQRLKKTYGGLWTGTAGRRKAEDKERHKSAPGKIREIAIIKTQGIKSLAFIFITMFTG